MSDILFEPSNDEIGILNEDEFSIDEDIDAASILAKKLGGYSR